jgi:hypothetical protein
MQYEVALKKAWSEMAELTKEPTFSVRCLGDTYSVDSRVRQILSDSCNVPAKGYLGILILHYLIRKIQGLPSVTGEWISFKELAGGEGYFPVFKKRIIGVIMKKCGRNPDLLLALVERFDAKRTQVADIGIVIEALEGVPLLITFWRGDDEVGPEVNVLYDRSVAEVYCTEDIVVLSELVAHAL